MSFSKRYGIPDLGIGVGFRIPHYSRVLNERPPMDWFEVISENFLVQGGSALRNLDRLRENYCVIPHGVSLSIGSVADLDFDYLSKLKLLVRRIAPPWCSDHLCWGQTSSVVLHDLLPLPYTMEVIDHVVERVKRVQDYLEVPFALENVSSYMAFNDSAMTECEFLSEIAERADCGILLDCNNIYVSARNHDFDPMQYVNLLPHDRVVQVHLAGHADKGSYLLDTHSDHVCEDVWTLYRRTIELVGNVSTLIEWDEDIPSWELLSAEADRARVVREQSLLTAAKDRITRHRARKNGACLLEA